jgi:ATP-binding cassette subfamily G (WHITE) protein 2
MCPQITNPHVLFLVYTSMGPETLNPKPTCPQFTNPRVLFLDEPTSGLDSSTANEVMTVVKGLANSGVTVVATIHSPTAHACALIDAVMLLCAGRQVYAGAPGIPMHAFLHMAVDPLAQSGADAAAATGSGALELEGLVDLMTAADRAGRTAELAAAWDASPQRAEMEAHVAAAALPEASWSRRCLDSPGGSAGASEGGGVGASVRGGVGTCEGGSKGYCRRTAGGADQEGWRHEEDEEAAAARQARELSTKRGTSTPWWHGFKTLVKYRTSRNYRDLGWLAPRFADKVIMGLLVTTLYWQIGASLTAVSRALYRHAGPVRGTCALT